MSNTELIAAARKQIADDGTTDSGGTFSWAIMYGALADALEAAEKERDHFREGVRALSAQLIETGQELSAAQSVIVECGRLAGQIMFDTDAEAARTAILDATRQYRVQP